MSDLAIQEKLSDVRTRVKSDDRVSISVFARSKDWMSKLAKNDFIEVQDRGKRIAWVISEEGMDGMIEYIDSLEERIEMLSVQAIFAAREDREDWKTGAELQTAALAYFRANKDSLGKVLEDGE